MSQRGGRGRGRGGGPLQMWECRPGKPMGNSLIKPNPDTGCYKLHVRSIPRTWCKKTLINAFSKVGEPRNVVLQSRPNFPLQYGYVEFGTFDEAREAVEKLNDNVVLDNIEIMFARDKADYVDSSEMATYDPTVDLLMEQSVNKHFPPAEPKLIDPKTLVKTVVNDDFYKITKDKSDEKYELGELDAETKRYMVKALYKMILEVHKENSASGECCVCKNASSLSCPCGSVYCSESCQAKDWPYHARTCKGFKRSEQATNQGVNGGVNNSSIPEKENNLKENRFNGNRFGDRRPEENRQPDNRPRMSLPDRRGGGGDRPGGKDESRRSFNNNFNQRNNGRRPGGHLNDVTEKKTMFEERQSRLSMNRQNQVGSDRKEGNEQGFSSNERFPPPQRRDIPKPVLQHPNIKQEPDEESGHKIVLGTASAGINFISKEQDFLHISNTQDTKTPEVKTVKEVKGVDEVVEKLGKVEVAGVDELLGRVSAVINGQESKAEEDKGLVRKGEKTEVVVVLVEEPGVYYVYAYKTIPECSLFLNKLSDLAPTEPFTPVENGVCASCYDGIWCRCKITSLSPLSVVYLDYGNIEVLSADRLFTIPPDLASKPPFAVKLKLAEGTPAKFLELGDGANLEVVPIRKEQDCWVAQVADVTYPTTPASKTPATPTVQVKQEPVDTSAPRFPKHFPPDVFTEVCVKYRSEQCVAVMPLSRSREFEEMMLRIQSEAGSSPAVVPQLKARCIVKCPKAKQWCRGRIHLLEPLTVHLVDHGNIEQCTVNDLKEIPPSCLSYSPFIINVRSNEESAKEIMQNETFSVKLLFKEGNVWIVEVMQTEQPTKSQANNQLAKPAFPTIFSSDSFTTVNVTLIDTEGEDPAGTYYVGPENIWTILVDMSNHFTGVADKCGVLSPKHGALGISRYEDGLWYRVKVVSISPLSVQYIDCGNIDPVKPEDLKICPETHRDIPRLVHRITLSPGTDKKYYGLQPGSGLSVRPTSLLPDGRIMVEVEGGNCVETVTTKGSTVETVTTEGSNVETVTTEGSNVETVTTKGSNVETVTTEGSNVEAVIKIESCIDAAANEVSSEAVKSLSATPTRSMESPHNITSTSTVVPAVPDKATDEAPYLGSCVELLQEGWSVCLMPCRTDKTRRALICQLYTDHISNTKLCAVGESFEHLMAAEQSDQNYRPNEGELVGCKINDEDWTRGQVLRGGAVALVDLGGVHRHSELKRLPQQFSAVPFMASALILQNGDVLEQLVEEVEITVTVEKIQTDRRRRVEVRGQVGDIAVVGELQSWNYEPLRTPHPLSAGDSVTICKVIDSNTVFVTPADNQMAEQKIQIECRKSGGKFETPPSVGDFVAVFIESCDIYCRSRIDNINEITNSYELFNIDVGTEIVTDLNKLHPLPESLNKIPRQVTQVKLKGVEKVGLTEEFQIYISNIVENEKALKIVSITDGEEVTLMTSEEEDVNKKLVELLKPKPGLNGKYTMRSLPPLQPTMNQQLCLGVVQTEPLYLQYCADNINTGEFLISINTYGESDTVPYNPCTDELCLVKFEGDWYRSLCLRETNQGISSVMLIDYGNMLDVSTNDIRRIQPELLKVPGLGLACKIRGLPPTTSPELRAALDEKLTVYTCHDLVIESESEGYYEVTMPVLLKDLADQKLI